MKLFDLFVTLGLDDAAFKKSIGSVKSVGIGAAKVIASSFGTSFAGVTALAKMGMDALSELEQNVGGSEKVFGEYASQLQEMGKDAYKTMGLSQSQYLATANKMASLMQGSGISVEDSMELTTKAMQRAADVASIMGIDVGWAMESIAGAAKGNFTMMDNLGVAMNATTIEAYALSKGIDTAYAEMDNATKIGLAMDLFLEESQYAIGNYAEENDTLAGSLNTAKAAWDNFLSGAGDADALAESLANAGSVLSEKLTGLLPGLVSGMGTLFQSLIPEIPGIIGTILPAMVEGAGTLMTSIAAELPNLVKSVALSIPDILSTLMDIDFGQFLLDLGETALTIAEEVVAPLLGQWWEALMGKINEIIDWILSPELPAIEDVVKAIQSWWKAITDTIGGLILTIFPEINTVGNHQAAAEEQIGQEIEEATGSSTLGALAQQNAHNFTQNSDLFFDPMAIINAFTSNQHETGLLNVPHDDYLARLHRGEMVLTRNEAEAYRRGGSYADVIASIHDLGNAMREYAQTPVPIVIDGDVIGSVMYERMNRRIEDGNIQQIFGMGG